ncbi:MAG: 50S ribosomal protein L15 [uncultured bacterium]|nr:MAG: 50S ribosomal protein L15 [uncultured bacterium]HLD45221.1 50S ribosomal protein L15 [bacterium]
MLLNQLRAPKGASKNRKRLGRGESSGLGKTSGRGHKGQKSRSGGYHKVGFEGGQMPLKRRLPKQGFHNIYRKEYAIVNVADLSRYQVNAEIDMAAVVGTKGKSKRLEGLKILGKGNIEIALTVKAHKFSKTAVEKIEKAGGKVVVLS